MKELWRQAGFANLVVLLVAVLLSVIAASFVQLSRTSTQLSQAHVAQAKARAAADGALHAAAFQLAEGLTRARTTPPALAPGLLHRRRVDGIGFLLVIEDEAAKVDLNHSGLADVQNLLINQAGLQPIAAQRLAQAIDAYRRTDGFSARSAGQPAPDGVSGLVLGMNDEFDSQPFDEIEELLAVPGMTREIYVKLAPNITVFAGLSDGAGGSASQDEEDAGGQFVSYTITVQPAPIDGATFSRQAIVSFPLRNPVDYVIRRWQAGPLLQGSNADAVLAAG